MISLPSLLEDRGNIKRRRSRMARTMMVGLVVRTDRGITSNSGGRLRHPLRVRRLRAMWELGETSVKKLRCDVALDELDNSWEVGKSLGLSK
ncbi:hypothetical protein ACSQ67_019850 [Phaseolus vulgaris]